MLARIPDEGASMPPIDVRLRGDRLSIGLVYENEVLNVSAAALWQHSRAAPSVAAAVAGTKGSAPKDLRISDVQLIGRYGLNIAFSDGDARGIYPWEFLSSLAERETGLDPDGTSKIFHSSAEMQP
jgi:DUF971 family protein